MADNIPGDLKYTREHEWARVQGTSVVVGVTQHAQESLGDVVYVELPKVGSTVTEGKQFGVIESTKAVSELYSPLTGKVVKVNDGLSDNPSTVNTDPYGAGWIVEIEPSDPKQVDGLLDAAAYTALLQNS
ncbi:MULTISPECIES: glycine cleavage system protein GcvH [Myxococcus]|uniref:Glycine cleavage system H protein n=1 Tax=Myxococcus virescens TaxID=83456 RepID=A0A511HJZ1_9BACT|nr:MULTISPECIES: glycine cleavage system protein GcvH [Myxococcus]NOK04372.1 glycine cleavage system protein GcvH [Myxococcus xanthus]QQR47275.1 glycine cleavage system protein GcvH [Myxococcus xanthus]WNZ65055.1 glycine cleavage system protein GcvH [Myxococcus sp. MxC21-1]SDE82071.1 glycine cleavage system H protein [Myxococcus virescens]GEL73880.1 glycine cleavage system H protein [Myxococcus virescens]